MRHALVVICMVFGLGLMCLLMGLWYIVMAVCGVVDWIDRHSFRKRFIRRALEEARNPPMRALPAPTSACVPAPATAQRDADVLVFPRGIRLRKRDEHCGTSGEVVYIDAARRVRQLRKTGVGVKTGW